MTKKHNEKEMMMKMPEVLGNLALQGVVVLQWIDHRIDYSITGVAPMIDLYNDYKGWLHGRAASELVMRKKTFAYVLKKVLRELLDNTQVRFVYNKQSEIQGIKLRKS